MSYCYHYTALKDAIITLTQPYTEICTIYRVWLPQNPYNCTEINIIYINTVHQHIKPIRQLSERLTYTQSTRHVFPCCCPVPGWYSLRSTEPHCTIACGVELTRQCLWIYSLLPSACTRRRYGCSHHKNILYLYLSIYMYICRVQYTYLTRVRFTVHIVTMAKMNGWLWCDLLRLWMAQTCIESSVAFRYSWFSVQAYVRVP